MILDNLIEGIAQDIRSHKILAIHRMLSVNQCSRWGANLSKKTKSQILILRCEITYVFQSCHYFHRLPFGLIDLQ